jgi:RHS repeat-associated protein
VVVVGAACLSMLATGTAVLPHAASAAEPAVPAVPSVQGVDAHWAPPPVDTTSVLTAPLSAALPDPGTATVALPLDGSVVKAGTLPISVAALPGGVSPASVRVTLLDQPTTGALRGIGVAFEIARTDGAGTMAPVRLLLDYSAWRNLFGANMADRLDVQAIPLCGPLGPVSITCPERTSAALTNNNLKSGVLDLTVQAIPDAGSLTLSSPTLSPSPSASASASPSATTSTALGTILTSPSPTATPAPTDSPSPTVSATSTTVLDPTASLTTTTLSTSSDAVDVQAQDDICAGLAPGFPLCGTVDRTLATVEQVQAPAYSTTVTPIGTSGNFDATSIAPTGHWASGGQSGDFSYSYPIALPPSLAGDAPDLTLQYSSQSVDGRTSARNNQASEFGMGWDYNPGYVEKTYMPCAFQNTNTNLRQYADLCQADTPTDPDASVYTLNLGGQTGRLFLKSDGTYRLEDDPGWRVQLLGSKWLVTTLDGTRYFFGFGTNGTGGGTATNSVWTVPVFATASGQCGYSTTSNGYCSLPWRWNLDAVYDMNGNAQYFYYTKQTNNYRSVAAGSATLNYVRAGALTAFEYGTRQNAQGTARVEFHLPYRCVQNAGGTGTCPTPSSTSGQSYPDAPVDQLCFTAPCTSTSPTFFDTLMVDRIDVKVMTSSGSYALVDQYQLGHTFPTTTYQASLFDQPDGETPPLWLDTITHLGTDAAGGESSNVIMPPTKFYSTMAFNRVDYDTANGVMPMTMPRILHVQTELGETITPTYSNAVAGGACGTGDYPNQTSDSRQCFAQWYKPKASVGGWSWWNKYVVTDIEDAYRTSAVPIQNWHYDYYTSGSSTGVLWNYDHDAGAVHHAFSDWRGFPRVRVTHGSGTTKTITDNWYYTGLQGEPTATDGSGSRTSNILSSLAGAAETTVDTASFAGRLIRNTTLLGGSYATSDWHDYVYSSTAAGPAGFVREDDTITSTPVSGAATRRTRVVRTYDLSNSPATGQLVWQDEYGAVDSAGNPLDTSQRRCTTIAYLKNSTDWILDRAWQTELHDSGCTGTIVRWTQTYYDGQALAVAPTKGNLTRTDTKIDSTHTQETGAAYDGYGRVTQAYVKAAGSPQTTNITLAGGTCSTTTCTYPTSITITDPDPVLTTTTLSQFDNARGRPTQITDANNRITRQYYDRLGRPSRTFLPTENPATACPSRQNVYSIAQDANSSVESKVLQSGDTCSTASYLSTWTFFDAGGRPESTQRVGPNGGRVVTFTGYDERGLRDTTTEPFYNSGTAGTYMRPDLTQVPTRTDLSYDGAERPTVSTLVSLGVDKWSTNTTYLGDRTVLTPPVGNNTTTYYDAYGRPTTILEPQGAASTDPSEDTRYTYNNRDDVLTIRDHAGKVTLNTYAAYASQLSSSNKPDAGVTSMTYDGAGNLLTSSHGTGRDLYYSYDNAQHLTGIHSGSAAGPIVRSWTWGDRTASQTANLRGRMISSSSFVGTDEYKTAVTYDDRGRPSTKTVTIPPSQPAAIAGNWLSSVTYDKADRPSTLTYPAGPAVAGLPAETVTATYNTSGDPDQLLSGLDGKRMSWLSYGNDGLPSLRRYGEDNTGNAIATRSFSYDATVASRVSAVRTYDGNFATVASDEFSYDAAGNPVQIKDATTGQFQCFRYDRRLRLAHAYTTDQACSNTPAPTYAAIGPAPYDTAYSYDTDLDALSSVTNLDGVTSYTYNDLTSTAPQPHGATSVGSPGSSTALVYNSATGELASRSVGNATTTYGWDVFGELQSTAATGSSTNNVYDADGSRLLHQNTAGSVTTTTLFLDSQDITVTRDTTANTEDQTATRFYKLAGTQIGARTFTLPSGGTATSTLRWTMGDRQGSAQLTMNANGTGVTRAQYTPFGAHRDSTTLPINRDFLGKVKDPDTGLVRLGARYYDANLGLFVSPDAMPGASGPASLNPYSYADNNPIALSDPTGLSATEQTWCDPCTNESPQPSPTEKEANQTARILYKTGGSLYYNVEGRDAAALVSGEVTPQQLGPVALRQAAWRAEVGFEVFQAWVQLAEIGMQMLALFADSVAAAAPTLGALAPRTPAAAPVTSSAAETVDASTLEGYRSFSAAKRALGSPGEGNVFDHVVEQSQIGRSGFSPEEIHHPFNMNPVSAETNQLKADYYSRKLDFTNGGTVRDWLSGKSFQFQYDFGMKTLADIEAGLIP